MTKIAIIGLSCLFPDAQTPEQFWHNLVHEKSAIAPATAEQLGVDPAIFYDPVKGKSDKTYYWRGGYIRDFTFDPHGYKLSPHILSQFDNLFQWSLYVARESLRDSGYLNNNATLAKCGVILGNLSFPTKSSYQLIAPIYEHPVEAALQKLLNQPNFKFRSLPRFESAATQNAFISGYPAAVVAQGLGLGGINFSLDAACASSLYAIKLACQYLSSHKADMMLAGGISGADSLFLSTGFANFQAYPDNGKSYPLDSNSGGLTTGEGAGMLVLKRYEEALQDGDQILSVICGGGLSNDGYGTHTLVPNPKGQMLAFERAYSSTGLDPKTVSYIECHATGTPVGDIVEINSMDSFFGRYQTGPLIGSVKSNLGHLLTTAGMAGVIKVVLSMQHELLPATIGITEPLGSGNRFVNNENVVCKALPWPVKAATKRAGVSAFGFGGTNAHLILEQPAEHFDTTDKTATPTPSLKMAIVGMEAFFGPCDSLASFDQTIYDGLQQFTDLPPQRWKGVDGQPDFLETYGFQNGKVPSGAYIKDFQIDALRSKIPPNELESLNPQQLLMLKVANKALHDAQISQGSNVAVIIAMGIELSLHRFLARYRVGWQIKEGLAEANIVLSPDKLAALEAIAKESIHPPIHTGEYISIIGNIAASRISSLWDFSGPAFTLSAEENSVFKALEIAQLLLAEGDVDAVVVGAVDLAGGAENVLLRNQINQINNGSITLSCGQKNNGWAIGEGAGAIVLKSHAQAISEEIRIYAVIDEVSILQEPPHFEADGSLLPTPSAETINRACRQAFSATAISATDVGYLELFGSGIEGQDEAEIEGILQAYQTSNRDLRCAMGSVKANIGHTYAASGMASLIKTALCLHHRYIPATPGWAVPKQPNVWMNSPFYVATESKPWFAKEGTAGRIAAISSIGLDGAVAHVLLSEDSHGQEQISPYLTETPLQLIPIAANNQSSLVTKLQGLQQTLISTRSLAGLAQQCFAAFQQQPQARYTLCLMGQTKGELEQEIALALKGLPKAFEQSMEWKTPRGSYFTSKPLGPQADIAFVYPGAFTAYVGLGRNLYHLFPKLYTKSAELVADMSLGIDQYFYPRSLQRLSARQLEEIEIQLTNDAPAMLKAGTAAALMYTCVLREYFNVQPKSAFGYSLGEFSMLIALDIWRNADKFCTDLVDSPLFNTRLSGPKNAVRDYWGLSPDTVSDGDLWETYALLAPEAEVAEALKKTERVYLTHINTPTEVIIAGERQKCIEVIKALQCDSFRAPFNEVLHCEVMRSEYDAFVDLLTLPIETVPSVNLYSAAEYTPITLDSESVGHNIAQALCQPLDFPRLIHHVYDEGARIFIELGPGGTCSRWIEETLRGKDFVAVPTSRRGLDDFAAILKVIARLVSHGIPVDLSILYKQTEDNISTGKSLIKTVTLGGRPTAEIILTDDNKKQFAHPAVAAPAKNITHNYQTQAAPQEKQQAVVVTNQSLAQPSQQITNGHTIGLPNNRYHKLLSQNRELTAKAHSTFLETRRTSLQQMAEILKQQINASHHVLQDKTFGQRNLQPTISDANKRFLTSTVTKQERVKSKPALFNEADMLEFAEGQIGKVFGPDYAVIDSYTRRVRLPAPPYLFASRITKLDAVRGRYEPCSIETEYDIPYNTWHTIDGQLLSTVAIEASHANMLLISYLGIDFENKGQRVYRALDGYITFLDELPRAGQTLRCVVKITSFVKSGDILIFFYDYDCFVDNKKLLKMKGGAGFFSDKDLSKAKGMSVGQSKLNKKTIEKHYFEPPKRCTKTTFHHTDLLHLGNGHIADCFGSHYAQNGLNPSLKLPESDRLMIDRVTSIDPTGGDWGLGSAIAEKSLNPAAWFFNCHFKNDLCLPGTLAGEGCVQLLQFYILYLGLQSGTTQARFQPIPGLELVAHSRGQLTPTQGTLTFRLEATEIGISPHPYVIANVDVIFAKKVIARIKDLGLQLSDKSEKVKA
ncbi:MAG: PfaB family protein [Anaerolineae bacterium]|nr:PfaB family protein [Anaerolineae bacterium]